MATFCFRCPECGQGRLSPDRTLVPCCFCDVECVRDYQAEAVGIAIGNLKRTREHTIEEYAAKFLPSNNDFAGPSDPEGKKGMRKWREEHAPSDSNKRPYYPGDV